MKGWKHKKTPIIVGNDKTPTKMESGQVIINKKATKQNLNKLIDINNDGLDKEKSKISTDGTDGGLLKGKPHYDKNGNSLGGIPVVVDGGKKIEVEGDEFVVNKEASQKHWKELSKINQSAGNGVPIKPNDLGIDTDPEEYKEGGRIIQFNPNDLPSQWIYNYAKKIKQNYPKVWDKGGNIFGNEAFVNLERVIKRGYWTDSEEWMYIKWRSYVARHKKDYRIEGVVAMLKWIDKVDKGWDYMKSIIEAEIEKKYPKKKTGGVVTYKNKYNKKFGYDKNESHDLKEIAKDTEVSKRGLQKIYNKGVGAYKTNPESVRPNVKSKEQWAMARVYSAVMGGKAAKVDAKELKMATGGGVEFIPEKKGTLIRGNQIIKYFEKVNGNYRLVFYTLNETKGKVPTICDSFGYCKELDTDNVTSKQLVELIKKNNLMEYGGMMEGQPPANFENVLYKELANRYEYGGGIKDIRCKCGWGWNKNQSDESDLYICHKCGNDNEMKYGGGGLKDINIELAIKKIDNLPQGKLFNDAKNIESIFNKSQHSWSEVIENFEKNKDLGKLEYIKLKDVNITQPNIQSNKVKNIIENINNIPIINVVQYKNGENVIFDGHHRLLANWAIGNDLIKAYLVKIDNKMKYGGELAKGIKVEAEHQNTFNKVYAHKLNPMQATKEVAKEHIKEDKNYYSKLAKMEKFNTGGAATGFEDGDIIRGEYYPGIYGNFLVVNAGADAVKVKNLLTNEESIKDFRDFTLFLKKGTGQTTATQPAATTTATQGYGKNFKFEIGDKVIYKGNNESATIKAKEFWGGVYFYNIVFDIGITQDDVSEMDLELEPVSMPTPVLPPTATQPTQPSQPAKPKFVPMDFQPFLQNWVNSNFINSTDLTKKEIVKDTITDFILDVEAVDGNQTIKFDQEAKILDNIDNYIN